MYPHNIYCLDVETNGSYSKAVTRILVITILLAVGLSVLGAWDVAQNDFQDEDFELSFIPENKDSEESPSKITTSDQLPQRIESFSEATLVGFSDVPVPEKGCFGPYDTLPGEMVIADQKLPTDPLPLCIDDSFFDGYYVIVGTYGGYDWVDGCISVIQVKSDDPFWCDNIVGYIDIDGREIFHYENAIHGYRYFNLTFTVRGEHPIVLDANHPPVSPLGDFTVWFDQPDLDKKVYLKVCTEWTGCGLPEQHFLVILAHKAMSQNKIPNSRYTSPV
ncbi:MAG: hypothetical protein ACFE9C_12765 [Candidatus Hodarchaeota archaeon]